MPREADIGTGTDVARVRRALQAERDAALLYRRLAEKLHEPAWRALVERLATEEESHAAHWAAWLVEAGEPGPELRPSVRSRLLGWLAGTFGIRAVAATALALFGVGALLATLSDRNPALGGARMLAIGGSAATVTYAVGRLLGASPLGA